MVNIVICMNDIKNLIVKYPISAKNDVQDMPLDAMLLDNCGVLFSDPCSLAFHLKIICIVDKSNILM